MTLTRAEILAMPAGRECDTVVARALGWREISRFTWMGYPPEYVGEVLPPGWPGRLAPVKKVPRYSTDIAAAWPIIAVMRERGWLIRPLTMVDGFVVNAIQNLPGAGFEQVDVDDAPHGIALAALLATLAQRPAP